MNQAFGRSRGGFGTKIHVKTDRYGLPLAFTITGGQAHDSPQFAVLCDIGSDIQPRAMIADKAYDSAENRTYSKALGATAVIPYRKGKRGKGKWFAKALYRSRA